MPWTVTHNKKLRLIETVYTGPVSAADIRAAVKHRSQLASLPGVRGILIDTTSIELTATMTELFDFPSRYYDEHAANRNHRLAVILPASGPSRKSMQFYVTACRNRFWRIEAFNHRDGALEWLLPAEDGSSSR